MREGQDTQWKGTCPQACSYGRIISRESKRRTGRADGIIRFANDWLIRGQCLSKKIIGFRPAAAGSVDFHCISTARLGQVQ